MTFNHTNMGSNPIILTMSVVSLSFLLLSNSFNLRRDLSLLFSRVSMIILLYSVFLGYLGVYIVSISQGIGIYSGLFNINCYTNFFQVFIYILTIFILILTGFYSRKVWLKIFSSINYILKNKLMYNNTSITGKKDEKYHIIEYPLIILFVLIGASFLISTSDIISIFLSIELQSYGLYLFSTLYRNSELATSGGLTYFLLGGLSSCFILLGTGLLYANSGTTSLDNIYIINHISEINKYGTYQDLYWYKPFYIYMSLLIMSVGFLFKVSAAPFHFWSPDVYDAIPTIVTTFVAIIAKISIFIFLLELVYHTGSFITNFNNDWKAGLLISSLLSLIIGTIVGLTQFRIKRLYAYSTISHLGFILLSISIYKIESIQSFIFYLTQYSVSNLNAFIILISIGYSLYIYINNNKEYENMLDKNNSPIQFISQLKGYFYINPILALSLGITLFSLIGIPPLIGFFAKQNVLSASLNNGYVFITFVAIITSVISAVYYLAIIKQVFFDKSEYETNPSLLNLSFYCINPTGSYSKNKIMLESIKISSSLSITISILTITMSLFIFIPQEWLSSANIIAISLFNP